MNGSISVVSTGKVCQGPGTCQIPRTRSPRDFLFLACLGFLAWTPTVLAAPCPSGGPVLGLSDIEDRYLDDDIDQETRDALLALRKQRIDLNSADRQELLEIPCISPAEAEAILGRRDRLGGFESLADLDGIKGLGPAAIRQVRAFATVSRRTRAVTAIASFRLLWRHQGAGPGLRVGVDTRFGGHGRAGMTLTAGPRIGQVRDAPPGGSLSAPDRRFRLDPIIAFAAWESPRWSVLLGSYRIGFGLRTTLDNTDRLHPDGWIPATNARESFASGTVSGPDAFQGLAARLDGLPLGRATLHLALFGSARRRNVYFTGIAYDRCPVGEPGCPDSRRVPVLVEATPGDLGPLETGSSLYCRYPTLPGFMGELLGGAHIAIRFRDRGRLGLTGYMAHRRFTADARDLRPAPSSAYPDDRSLFGAVGMHGNWRSSSAEISAEITVTDQGAPAALVSAWFQALPGLEIEPSLRYYSPGFDNPYSRGEADPDQYLGNRGRDELGGRLRMTARPVEQLRIMAEVDVWHHRNPGTAQDSCDGDHPIPDACTGTATGASTWKSTRPSTDLAARFRIAGSASDHEDLSAWLEYRDKHVGLGGRGRSYRSYSTSQQDLSGGSRVSWGISAATKRLPWTSLGISFRQSFEDVASLKDRFDHSWSLRFNGETRIPWGTGIGLGVLYRDESTTDSPRSPGQVCCNEQRGDIGLPPILPGACRGETLVDVAVRAYQALPRFLGTRLTLSLGFGWSRHLDLRGKWTYGSPCNPDPSRDDFRIQASLAARY